MEKQILEVAKKAIGDAIVKELTGYNSPLNKLCAEVIDDHSVILKTLLQNTFGTLIKSTQFKQQLKEALNKKLANILLNKMGGELEKRVNDLRADPTTRAKITLAINNIIEENSNEKTI